MATVQTQKISATQTILWVNGNAGEIINVWVDVPASKDGIKQYRLSDNSLTPEIALWPPNGEDKVLLYATETPTIYEFFVGGVAPPVEPAQPLPASMNKLLRVPQL